MIGYALFIILAFVFDSLAGMVVDELVEPSALGPSLHVAKASRRKELEAPESAEGGLATGHAGRRAGHYINKQEYCKSRPSAGASL